jgi:probable DNA metabolism protein
MSTILTYDGTYEGFLSVVFECYSRKISPENICSESGYQETFFSRKEYITSAPRDAERVWLGLKKRLSKRNSDLPFTVFISGAPEVELKLFRFIKRIFDTHFNIETDYGDPDVMELKQIERKVLHEAMRMIQFVRFQKSRDNIYFSAIEPAYDVLPLVIRHFKSRFADQRWVIYDLKRDYGIAYDLKETQKVVFTDKGFNQHNGDIPSDLLQEKEEYYQTMWGDYFNSINIKERKNLKLHRQHMPKRYWKFLPEKKFVKN